MTDRLPRFLGPGGAALYTAGSVIGSAIFRVPAEVATSTGSVAMSILFWVFGAVFALCGALCYAELSVRLPRAGADYAYLHAGFGPLPAFLMGWILLFAGPAGVAAGARAFADYLSVFVPLPETGARLVRASVIISFATVAMWSSRAGAQVVSGATIAKLLAIFGVVMAGLLLASSSVSIPAPSLVHRPTSLAELGLGFAAIMWAYDGYSQITMLGGEVREPKRTLPVGLLLGLGLVVAAYLLLNVTYLKALGFDGVATSRAVASDAMRAVLGTPGAALVAILVMVSTLGTLAAQLLATSRCPYAMADDGLFPPAFARLTHHGATPAAAIALCAALAVALVCSGKYAFLMRLSVLSLYPLIALSLLVTVRMRRRYGPPPGFAMPLYPLPLVVFVCTVAGVWLLSLIGDPPAVLYGVLATAMGVVFYAVKLRRPTGPLSSQREHGA